METEVVRSVEQRGSSVAGRSDPRHEAVRYRARAARSAARAARAGASARYHERLAGEGMSSLAARHASIAATHRRSEARQLAVTSLYERHARRLEIRRRASWVEAPGLIESVAEQSGGSGVYLNLIATASVEMVLASNATARAVHDAEVELGYGPSRTSVVEGPLTADHEVLRSRWPLLAAAIEPLGVAGLSSVPLRERNVTLGSLTVLTVPPAGGAAVALKRLTVVAGAVFDALTMEFEEPEGADTGLLENVDTKDELHQAAGIVSARCDCPIGDAVDLVRARAFSAGVDVCVLARAVISGDERFECV